MMSKLNIQADSHVTRQQVIMVDLSSDDIEPDVDVIIFEIVLAFGRPKRISIPADRFLSTGQRIY